MKNKRFWLVLLVMVLAFGMTFVGCGGDDKDDTSIPGGGTLTLTGIPSEYNGKYAVFMGETDDAMIIGAKSLSGSTSGKAAKISGGSVSLTLWIVTGETNIKAYKGNDTITEGSIMIFAQEAANENTSIIAYGDFFDAQIKFSNGNGSLVLTSDNSEFGEGGFSGGGVEPF